MLHVNANGGSKTVPPVTLFPAIRIALDRNTVDRAGPPITVALVWCDGMTEP